MNQAVINTLQTRFGTADFSRFQIIRQPKYDTVRYPSAGADQLAFFVVPQGGTDPVSGLAKTQEQTNLVKSSSFGQEYFVLTGIRTFAMFLPKSRQPAAISGDTDVIWSGFTGAANGAIEQLIQLHNQGVLVVNFGQKNYLTLERPLLTAPFAAGVDIQEFGAVKPTSFTTPSFWAGPSNRNEDLLLIDPILVIEPEQTINVSIQYPDGTSPAFTNTVLINADPTTATPNVEVGVVFEGYTIRPNQ